MTCGGSCVEISAMVIHSERITCSGKKRMMMLLPLPIYRPRPAHPWTSSSSSSKITKTQKRALMRRSRVRKNRLVLSFLLSSNYSHLNEVHSLGSL